MYIFILQLHTYDLIFYVIIILDSGECMDIKCPNCGNNLVEIIYGMPTSEIIEKANKIFKCLCAICGFNFKSGKI